MFFCSFITMNRVVVKCSLCYLHISSHDNSHILWSSWLSQLITTHGLCNITLSFISLSYLHFFLSILDCFYLMFTFSPSLSYPSHLAHSVGTQSHSIWWKQTIAGNYNMATLQSPRAPTRSGPLPLMTPQSQTLSGIWVFFNFSKPCSSILS